MSFTKIIKNIKSKINISTVNYLLLIGFLVLSFLANDVALRYMVNQTNYYFYNWYGYSPNLFSLSWISALLIIILILSRKNQKIVFIISVLISNILFIAQYVHFKIFSRFLGVSDIFLAGEGKNYAKDVVGLLSKNFYLILILMVVINIITYYLISIQKEKITKQRKRTIVIVGLIMVAFFRGFALLKLGDAVDRTAFKASSTPKNVYLDFNEQNKSMQVAGMYEHFFRGSFLYTVSVIGPQVKENYQIASDYFNENNIEYDNALLSSTERSLDYNGYFKDKNIIYVLMESIDSFIVNSEVMPTLTMMKKTGWDFTNRYASAFGGGWTFNTEFAANIGLYSINNYKAAYNFDSNSFLYSLPNLFQNDGYIVNSVHANYGKFYNRNNIHKAFGYSNHYALAEQYNNLGVDVFSDKDVALNDTLYRLIVPEEGKFMTFFTSFTGHMPYNNDNPNCKNDPSGLNIEGNETLSCYRNLARNTDDFFKIMIEKLNDENRLNDTIFVLFSDHYAYGYNPIEYVYEKRNTNDTNMLQNIPFIIWNPTLDSRKIDTIMDTSDLVPTIANLFGLTTYDPNNYLSTDVFSSHHDNFVYFGDGSWYDGTIYSKNPVLDSQYEYVKNITAKVNEKIRVNDAILKSDYYRRKHQEK